MALCIPTREHGNEVKVPTVAIVGEKDAGQRERVDRWKGVRADLQVVLVPEADHVSCVFKEELRSAIHDFFVKQREHEK